MHRILILDFGSQTTMLIARRIRELHVYCEIWPCTHPVDAMQQWQPSGIVLSGGPASVYDVDAPPCPDVFSLGVPVLGICYGMQAMARQLGGAVAAGTTREFGHAQLRLTPEQSPFLHGIDADAPVWMSHGDHVTQLPPGFVALAHSRNGALAAMGHAQKHLYGVQFHPEVVHTRCGLQMLERFVRTICACPPQWTMASFVQTAVAAIRAQVGARHVLCALSGGVDSSVTAALLQRAIGPQLHCVFVDNGLLRQGEAADVERILGAGLGIELHTAKAGDRFLAALAGISEPEAKRKIIGGLFIDVFEAALIELGRPCDFLAQGTLYPDVIESHSFRGPSATIKSHHNVGGLPARLRMQLVEPLRELFKDEVRALGRELGLPASLVQRQPFPGPGLAVRVVGEVTPQRVSLLQAADAIVRQEIEAWAGHVDLWQYFAALLPVQSVGVMGDARTYESTCAVRAVTSTDGMTADWADIPRAVLARISGRIINEVRGINRVVYDISSKPPATIEWE